MKITPRSTMSGGALLAAALLFIGITMLLNQGLRGWRLDLTQNRLYTIAPGTDRILASIKEPINLYFFFSEKSAAQYPQIKTYSVRVRELLEELAARSNGKLRLHRIDPQPFSEDEDRAAELGVRPTPLDSSGGSLYFGLAGTNSVDGHAAIPFFDWHKEQFLEYDVVKLIHQLANPKKPVVAWLSSLNMGPGFDPRSGRPREPWVIYGQAEQLFDVRTLDANATRIDPDVAVLVIVHPKNLPPATQFAIDQYALRGGHILLFVDPIAEADESGADPGNPMAQMSADKASQLGALLTAWGVSFDPHQVIADRAHALSVSMRQDEPPVPHLAFLGLDKSAISAEDVITAPLSAVNVATAGFLAPAAGAKTHFETLLQSSTEAAPLPAARFQMLFDPSSLREGFKPTGKRYTLAARVTGAALSAFPNGPPAGVTLPAGQTPLKSSAKPMNLIVVADTDLLADYLWVREQSFFGQRIVTAMASNGDLVLNAIENLAGSSDLISIRGRARFTRPFERVEALRRSADDRFRTKEQELEKQLRDTEDKLTALQSKRNDQSALILTPEQEQAIDRFQSEKLRIRKELRAVRAGLDAEIRGLGMRLKVINILLVPAAFAVAALLFALWRRRRTAARYIAEPSATSPQEPKP